MPRADLVLGLLVAAALTLGEPTSARAQTQGRAQLTEIVNEAPIPIEVTNPVMVTGPVEDPIQFLGMSASLVQGHQGPIVKHEACNSTFPGSRMCTTEQVVASLQRPFGQCHPSGLAGWVRPSLAALGLSPGFTECDSESPPDDCDTLRPVVVDTATGVSNSTGVVVFPGNLFCGAAGVNESAGEDFGLALDCPNGRPRLRQCRDSAPVACCGLPVPQPSAP
jgi:hypothetical protein